MQENHDETAAPAGNRRKARMIAPSVAPFPGPIAVRQKSRSILTDAAACFVATALGSLAPQALSFLDLTPKEMIANVDPDSGKFLDRVLIGGLQPFMGQETESAAPPPRFLAYPITLASADEAGEARPAAQKAAGGASVRVREASVRRTEKAAEPKDANVIASPPMRASTEVAAAPEARHESETAGQGLLASLTPSSVSSKLAPAAERVWTGAKSVGGAVTSGLSWLGY